MIPARIDGFPTSELIILILGAIGMIAVMIGLVRSGQRKE